jgi:hypothetical protein
MTDGVKNVQVMFIDLMTSVILFSRSSSLGTQTVPPKLSVVRISMTLASNVYDANCRTLDVEYILSAGAWAAALAQKAAC